MVAPVAGVEGPVAGTTWSSVQPWAVGPGSTAATPGVWAMAASAARLGAGGDDDLQGAGGAGTERGGHLVVADPGVGRRRDDGD